MERVQRNTIPVLESLEELGIFILPEESQGLVLRLCVYIIKKNQGRATGQVERVRRQQGDLGHVRSSNNHLFTCLGEALNHWAEEVKTAKTRESCLTPSGTTNSHITVPWDRNHIPSALPPLPHPSPLPITHINNNDPEPRREETRTFSK